MPACARHEEQSFAVCAAYVPFLAFDVHILCFPHTHTAAIYFVASEPTTDCRSGTSPDLDDFLDGLKNSKPQNHFCLLVPRTVSLFPNLTRLFPQIPGKKVYVAIRNCSRKSSIFHTVTVRV